MAYCEDYPCCGHTPSDPCERQPYDEPGYFDTTRNEHALCDHEEGFCEVWYDDEPEIEPENCDHADGSWTGFSYTCDVCGTAGIALVKVDFVFATDPEIKDVIVFPSTGKVKTF